jgi:hypothetical protein
MVAIVSSVSVLHTTVRHLISPNASAVDSTINNRNTSWRNEQSSLSLASYLSSLLLAAALAPYFSIPSDPHCHACEVARTYEIMCKQCIDFSLTPTGFQSQYGRSSIWTSSKSQEPTK